MSEKQDKYKVVGKMAIEKYGDTAQIDKLIEEMGELTTALIHRRYDDGKGNVEEEIADVEIMIMQAREIFDSKTIDNYKRYKIERLESNIMFCG